ncbi:MAG: DUF1858 domain-containing protein [Candidatus Peregrinibacteria bacterium]
MPSRHPPAPSIRGDIPILDLLAIFPESTEILAAYGLACFSCPFGGSESLEDGCRAHGFPKEVTKALLNDLNRLLTEKPHKEEVITITKRAAKEAVKMAKQEKNAKGLRVQLDGQGSFCMEFRAKPEKDDRIIKGKDAAFPLYVPRLLFSRLSGATIDYRGGRFQLDLRSE